jgi:hypothetical protein
MSGELRDGPHRAARVAAEVLGRWPKAGPRQMVLEDSWPAGTASGRLLWRFVVILARPAIRRREQASTGRSSRLPDHE